MRSRGEQVQRRIERSARQWRARFDSLTRRVPAVLLVSGLAAVAVGAGALVNYLAFRGCRGHPFSLMDLQLTFSGQTFAALFRSARDCRGSVILSFVTSDLLFPLCYALFLCALYLWVERFRRFLPDGRPPKASLSWLSSVIVILPFAAAIFDVVGENLPLLVAALLLPHDGEVAGTAVSGLVWAGSLGAALKWTALGAYFLGLAVMLLRGPRGQILWRLRFSVLAVLGGSLAVLSVPQGQDILQRLVEGEHPYVRIVSAVAALTLAALVVWYSGRVLSLVRLSCDPPRDQDDPWMPYFEHNIPRMLGIAVLALGGAAFARAASAFLQFSGVVVLSYLLAVLLANLGQKEILPTIGRRLLRRRLRGDAELSRRVGRAALAVVLGAFIVWPRSLRPFEWSYDDDSIERYVLRLAAWLAVAAAWGLYLYVYRHDVVLPGTMAGAEHRQQELQGELQEYPTDALPPAAFRTAVSAGGVSAALFLAFTFFTVPFARFLGPLVVLALTVANAVYVGSVLSYLGRKFRLPLVTILLALAALFSRWNDNHAIRTLPIAPAPDTLNRSARLRATFETWLAARGRERSSPGPIVLVAAAGGGLRAAYWTAVTLATLQDRDSTFARHVFAISGVSGGSLGAAVFVAMVRDLPGPAADADCLARVIAGSGPAAACARWFMADDFLSPVLAKMVAPDFLQWFVPIPIRAFDRATALEQSWEASYRANVGDSTFALGYLSFYREPSLTANTPLLLLNTTHVQTGRRYVTAPFVDDGVFLDARSVTRALGADLPLSTAVHNSARFTYVSPAGRIERRDGVAYGALVDGGYFENSGLATLAEVRRVLDAVIRERGGSNDPELVVLYLCNDPTSCRRDLAVDSSLAARHSLAGEWLSPLIALFRTRDARGSLARAESARAPGARFFQLNVCDSLNVPNMETDSARYKVARERAVNPPLGWQLSRLARQWMDSSLTLGTSGSMAAATDSVHTAGGPCRARNVAALDSILAMLSPSY